MESADEMQLTEIRNGSFPQHFQCRRQPWNSVLTCHTRRPENYDVELPGVHGELTKTSLELNGASDSALRGKLSTGRLRVIDPLLKSSCRPLLSAGRVLT